MADFERQDMRDRDRPTPPVSITSVDAWTTDGVATTCGVHPERIDDSRRTTHSRIGLQRVSSPQNEH
jgi:hypothetical protein